MILCRFLVEAFFRPCSDFVLKPSLVSVHNLWFVPSCALARNVSVLCAAALGPVCNLKCCCCKKEEKENLVKEV